MTTLKPEYEELYEEFLELGGCTCFNNPPCNSCTHPGNPMNLECNDDAWITRADKLDLI